MRKRTNRAGKKSRNRLAGEESAVRDRGGTAGTANWTQSALTLGGSQNRHRRKVPRPWLLAKSRGNYADGKKHRRGVDRPLSLSLPPPPPPPFTPISTPQTSLVYARATKFAVVPIRASNSRK